MVKRLLQVVEHFARQRIVVLGDLVADEYIMGLTSRISREAPVLILKFDSRHILLGGAANTVHNIWSLGGEVFPIGLVGDDEPGRTLKTLLQEHGIDTSGVLIMNQGHTSTKTRILAGGQNTIRQQVIRIDREGSLTLDSTRERKIRDLLQVQLSQADALLISDYGLGLLTESLIKYLNTLAKKGKQIITVDSRYQLLQYRYATAYTPNEPEVEAALGWSSLTDDTVLPAGRALLRKTKGQGVLITRGKKGMALCEATGKETLMGIFGSDEAVDATGAGDTVIGTFTLALAAGATMEEAAQLANYAGGIVVMKRGTAVVEEPELREAIVRDTRHA
jgi:rfaE bifunctional protein kinase chain/domain